jgi:hypothetical protein
MARTNKTRRQIIILGAILLACAAVLVYSLMSGSGPAALTPFVAPAVDRTFSRAVFDNPEYSKLSTPVQLPIPVGPLGNQNPFASAPQTKP